MQSDSFGRELAMVIGADGIVGRNLVEQLRADGRAAVAVGRRAASIDGTYVSVDLADRARVRAALGSHSATTHVFFAAYATDSDPHAEVERNLVMLINVLDALDEARAPLRHVTLYQGSRAYGSHLGAFRTPAKETDPRVDVPLFYYAQEDWARTHGPQRSFTFTVLRPDHITGIASGSFVNLLHTLAGYATLCKASGLPLAFPGGELAYRALFQMTDARLLARASIWAACASRAQNQIFNVTNGDLMRWENTWPQIARYFGVPLAAPTHIDLQAFTADKASLWDALAVAVPLKDMTNWKWGNAILSVPHEIHSSTVKIRQAGFGECMDSEARLFELLDEMKRRRLIPAL